MVSEQLNFVTNSPLITGQLLITPPNGTALSTIFTISLLNWSSAYQPILYQLYSIIDGTSNQSLLTTMLLNGSANYSTILPELTGLAVYANDSSGEIAQYS